MPATSAARPHPDRRGALVTVGAGVGVGVAVGLDVCVGVGGTGPMTTRV